MYKAYTADDWRAHLGLTQDYTVDGLIVFGTYQRSLYDMLQVAMERLGHQAEYRRFQDEFLEPILEFRLNGKCYWFVIAYGGALLSEYLHLACMFGSKKNILLGTCGGLKHGANSLEFIVPDWSFAEESSAKGYQPDTGHRYKSNTSLSGALADALAQQGHTVHRGPTVTYQAMLGETWEDIQKWSTQGYVGVEMEAATVFAVSNHFGVPAAALLRIGDNLIEKETVVNIAGQQLTSLRHEVSEQALDIALRELLQ